MSLFFENDEDDMYDYFPGEYVFGEDCYVRPEYMDEKWWYISGIPYYMVSDMGRVWSEKRQQFLKVKPMDNHGHLGVCLSVDGRSYYEYIHRLMAKAFIPNPNDRPVVRHLDGDPGYNTIDNLAWGTQRDNWYDSVLHGTAKPPTDKDREKGFQKVRRPIIAVNLSTGDEIYFRGQGEASRELFIQQANIWKVLNGERRTAGGYYFKYVKGRNHERRYY